MTAAEVAAELEVSVATARRDLEALSSAGVPVYPQSGRGGGWRLVGGARTDLSGLTAAEARALFLLVGPAAAVAPEVKAALRKLVRALPDTFRADAEAAASAVVVDSSGWGERERVRSGVVEVLQAAVVRRVLVRFGYASRGREVVERVVDPWGLVDKDDVWYLVAGTEGGRRTFRVDRMVGVVVTDSPAAGRPAGFDLSVVWDEVVEEVERRRGVVSAVVVAQARHVRVLRDQFGRQCEVVGEVGDGRVRVRVAASAPLMIAQVLAGWGALVEVEESDVVRAELARLGSELVARYAG
ncbi:putative DNA-binding transcriptional regulator YafY [Kibdelosporangium phytohabitans]|nr:putative DNA-binding transcriptional regulator YafY [Kibdelosporangium phytohabitans]